jgi:hypothetical protein
VHTIASTPPVQDLSPEFAVLLWAVQGFFHPGRLQQFPRALVRPIDWNLVFHLARTNGVLPLVYKSLYSTADPALLSGEARAALRAAFEANTQRNLFLAGTLLKILNMLNQHGIEVLPYKGPVLAMQAYGNLALRQFGDLDLLIHSDDVDLARNLLFAQGYRWPDDRPPGRFPRLLKVYELTSPDRRVLVELHWAITSASFPFPLDPAPLWTRAETICLLGKSVRSLAPEDLLLILCVHGSKHHWSRLAWICDVAAVLDTSSIDWDCLIQQAHQLGAMRMLALGLRLAHDLLGVNVPPEVRRIPADTAVPWLVQKVRESLFAATAHPPEAWDHPEFYLRLRERVRDKLPCYLYLAYRRLLPSVVKNRLARHTNLTLQGVPPFDHSSIAIRYMEGRNNDGT